MSYALITGGAGFIGLHLARRLLDDGWRVDLLDNFARGRNDTEVAAVAARNGAVLLEADLGADRDRINGAYTHVFHFAAVLGVQAVIDDPLRVLRTNVDLTVAALEIAARSPALERFVFASTSEVYAGTLANFDLPIPTPETVPLALTDLASPRTSYMLSKLYGEAMCVHAGLPTTIVRPHNVFGPRMGLEHVIPQLLQRADACTDDSLDVYSVDHTRTFCFIDDAVEMIRRLAVEPRAAGETVNVGTESPEISIGDLTAIILDAVGKGLKVVPRPATQGSPARRAPNMALCRDLTGFASQVSLADGVGRTYRWYKENVFDHGTVQ